MTIDEIDAQILTMLQENARLSNAEVGRRVGLTASAVLERIRKLERGGVLRGYAAQVDPEAVGLHVLALVAVRLSPHRMARAVGQRLTELPGVQEVLHMTGEDCFTVKVRCADTGALEELVMAINDIEGVTGTRTSIAFRALRESLRVPVGAQG
ncbi:Lrp/AsnC family transcriptional regulator [Desulfocurvus sp. DL9XJH121]